MPTRAFGTFFDGVLTRQERACLTSFIRAGHRVSLYSYAPIDVPDGVEARDAAEILPHTALYYDHSGGVHHGAVSQFSNYFRYAMIARTGLAWIDTDVICLRSDWPQPGWLMAPEDRRLINGAILGVPREHPFLARAIEAANRLRGVMIWGYTGPHLITALVEEFRLQDSLLPTDALYPLHYSRAAQLVTPLRPGDCFRIPDAALCVHLWNEVLRNLGYDKVAGPPAGSALAALLDMAEGLNAPSSWDQRSVQGL